MYNHAMLYVEVILPLPLDAPSHILYPTRLRHRCAWACVLSCPSDAPRRILPWLFVHIMTNPSLTRATFFRW